MAGKKEVFHTNIIVNEQSRHEEFIIYTGLPDSLKNLYSEYVRNKVALEERYPWINEYLCLDSCDIGRLPQHPRIRLAINRVLDGIAA